MTKIGTMPVYATRRAWLDRLRQKAELTQYLTQEGTFDAGCNFLLHWYANEVMPTPSDGDWWSDLVVA